LINVDIIDPDIIANFLNDDGITVRVGEEIDIFTDSYTDGSLSFQRNSYNFQVFLDTHRTFCIQSPHIKPAQGKIPIDTCAKAHGVIR
jgi:hypothetical protein